MKVLVVNAYFSRGGAARAAQRLALALSATGVDVHYVSIFPELMNWRSRVGYLVRAFLDRIPGCISARKRVMFSQGRLTNHSVVKRLSESDADIIHFHWMQGGALSFDDMLAVRKPVFISLHDMWLFTGGCHYDEECGRYLECCGNCPVINSSRDHDVSYSNLLSKRRSVMRHGLSHVSVVGLSRWLASAAKASSLLQGAKVHNLPNPIDASVFSPRSSDSLRDRLKIPRSNKIILFGAMQSDDVRKGGSFLKSAISKIKTQGVSLVVFGGGGEGFNIFDDVHIIGHVGSDEALADLYRIADVMVVPSLQENLSNAIMESMACGTPVVAFNVGGNGDMIDHCDNGYLARLRDVNDLVCGIEWIIYNKDHVGLRSRAREKILRNFEQSIVARRYKDLYEEVLGK